MSEMIATATPDQQPYETHIDGYDVIGDEHYALAVRRITGVTLEADGKMCRFDVPKSWESRANQVAAGTPTDNALDNLIELLKS
jgi:hypothetical protein